MPISTTSTSGTSCACACRGGSAAPLLVCGRRAFGQVQIGQRLRRHQRLPRRCEEGCQPSASDGSAHCRHRPASVTGSMPSRRKPCPSICTRPSITGETGQPARRSATNWSCENVAPSAADQHRRTGAAEHRGGAVIGGAGLLVQRLHAAPQRGRGHQPDQQCRQLHRMPPPMAQQHREHPEQAAHASSPACSVTWRSSVRGEARAVGHHQEAAAGSCHEVAVKRQNVVGGGLVEIAGRFVRQQQQRLDRERAPDRDPLLLAAGQLFGIALQQRTEPEPIDQFGLPGRIKPSGNARLKCEIVFDMLRLGIRLNCWNTSPSRSRRSAARSASERPVTASPSSLMSPPSAAIEARDQMQQRALAAAGFAGQRHALAGRDIEAHPAQHADLLAGRAVGLGQVTDAQHDGNIVMMRNISSLLDKITIEIRHAENAFIGGCAPRPVRAAKCPVARVAAP